MNLFRLVWDKEVKFGTRLEAITSKKLELENKVSNQKELTFDIYYPFSRNLEEVESINQQWKQIQLALDVIRITRKWNRKYQIDLRKKVSGEIFIDFFKNSINTSKNFLCSNGINFYVNEKYTIKTLVIWAYKLLKLGIIGEILYNEFMIDLERISNNG